MAGWESKKIGDVCTIVGGGTPSRSNPAYFGGSIPWATVRDMKFDWIERTEFTITPFAVKNSATNIIPAGSVIVASRVGLGKVCRVRQDTAINQDLRGFLPKSSQQLDPQYLFLWFKSVAQKIVAAGTGATVQGVTLPFLRSLEIPVPPIEEQRRIVAVLDEAFAAIAIATANAEKNLAKARELFDAILRDTLADNVGAETALGDATSIKVGFAFKSGGYTTEADGIRLVRGDNVVQGRFRWEDVKRWPRNGFAEYADYQLKEGDVVLAMDRTWVKAGLKFAVVGPSDVPSLLVQRVARLRAKESISSDFIALQIASAEFTKYVLKIQTGLGVPHISGKQIADFQFTLPARAKQDEIVGKMKEAKSLFEAMSSHYARKCIELNNLKQSFLHRAFSGELTVAKLEPLPT